MGKIRKVYLAISYANRNLFDDEVKALTQFFRQNGMEILVFVDKYDFGTGQEKEMMQKAFKAIDSADMLLAELTTRSIGVGIEIGYACARKKPVIYLRKEGAEYATTAAGSAAYTIEYKNASHLQESMNEIIQRYLNKYD